jgi:hypothetical protein
MRFQKKDSSFLGSSSINTYWIHPGSEYLAGHQTSGTSQALLGPSSTLGALPRTLGFGM